ncbi:hypothetical protein ONS95_002418 [Cadophora gregata]|uniref:uncharacterized protein n=1 Tax=Cadophora gregata TaxID=51156 RepID=UPI0026DB1656|nr:uncharacterized protein ONS95_002418 [Cadophora gregata]KAK0109740.1 hypothetical protein ONS95_002418 [Cadophora gregata]
MDEFIELGLEGADKMIDKHFDKVPDKALNPETYKKVHIPGRRKSRKDSKDSHSDHESKSDRGRDTGSMSQQPPEYRHSIAEDPGYSYIPESPRNANIPSFYSREPPHPRPEYMPSPPPSAAANPYYSPPPTAGIPRMAMNRGRDVDPYDDADYHSDSYRAPRRPKAVTRRSSSYHGPRDRDSYGYDQQLARRHGSGSDRLERYSDRAKDTAHRYKLKEDMNNVFTASKVGLTGGAVGAVVGGWAAQKAQIGYRKDGHKADPNPLLTLLGATVGGLAVNAVVDKWQDGKKETAKKQEKWENKYGSEDESDGGRSRRSHRSHHRSRRDSYD